MENVGWIQIFISFFDRSTTKVNSVQEACTKCFAVHILKFEIFQITWKKGNKGNPYSLVFHQMMFFILFLHVVCKISNSNMWTTKHLAKASCTELTLPWTKIVITSRRLVRIISTIIVKIAIEMIWNTTIIHTLKFVRSTMFGMTVNFV